MSVVRVRRRQHFTITPNAALREPTLSLAAKGLLAVLLSYPDDWDFYVNHILQQSSNGRDAHRSAMKELQDAGYITRAPKKLEDGSLAGWDWTVTDEPRPSDGKPVGRETRRTENPSDGKPDTTKTDLTKTDTTKTEKASSGKPDASQVQAVVDAYNDYRGDLPAARVVNSGRAAKIRRLIRDLGGVRDAVVVMGIAASEVAHDPFWRDRRYGLDNLLSQQRAIQKAESAAARGSTNRDDDAASRIRAALHGAQHGR